MCQSYGILYQLVQLRYGMVWYGMVWYGIETLNVSLHRKQVKLQGIKFNHNTHFKADHI